MKAGKKRLMGLLLAACMVLSTPVMPVAAEEQTDDPTTVTEITVGEVTEDASKDTEEPSTLAEEPDQTDKAEAAEEDTEEPSALAEEPGDETGGQEESEEPANTDVPAGEGTEASPYQISTAEQLKWFAGLVNGTLEGVTQNTAAHAELTNDIVLNEGVESSAREQWTPIGLSRANSFRGIFVGNDFSINGVYIKNEDGGVSYYYGLFGYIGETGVVKDLRIENSEIIGGYNSGAIAGESRGEIYNCHNVNCYINGYNGHSGGIVGTSWGNISNCTNSGTIEVTGGAGGIVGHLREGRTLSNCKNSGTVKGEEAGGICGDSYGGVVDSHNTGDIEGYYHAGGIAGYAREMIQYSTNSGTVSSHILAGGIAGEVKEPPVNRSISNKRILNCSNSGAVTLEITDAGWDSASAGGIVGRCEEGIICGSYNTGTVDSFGEKIELTEINEYSSKICLGGIVGDLLLSGVYGAVSACYNTGNIGSDNTNANVIGGLIGYNQFGIILDCYNAGVVAEVDDSQNISASIVGYNYKNYEDYVFFGACFYKQGTSDKGVGIEVAESNESWGTELPGELDEMDTTPVEMTGEQFASGEVTYELNKWLNIFCEMQLVEEDATVRDMWRQNLSGTEKDETPVLDGTHSQVYAEYKQSCPDSPKSIFSYNNESEIAHIEYPNHFCGEGIVCSFCGNFAKEVSKDENGVYQIGTAGELYWFAAKVNGTNGLESDPGASAVLTADITVNEQVLDSGGTLAKDSESYRQWQPIGYGTEHEGVTYEGTFDGKGHTISGLYMSSNTDYDAGLFGSIGCQAQVHNVNVSDAYFATEMPYSTCGGIAGRIAQTGETEVDAVLESGDNAVISGCSFNGIVKAVTAGGIIGSIWDIEQQYIVYDCINYGHIFAIDVGEDERDFITAGGIVGESFGNDVQIIKCANEGNISSANFVGGLFGRAGDGLTLVGSYNTGKVEGFNYAGGLGGRIYASERFNLKIISCYNSGEIYTTAQDDGISGGILGVAEGIVDVDTCYYNESVFEGEAVGAIWESGSLNAKNTEAITSEQFASGWAADQLNKVLSEKDEDGLWYQTLEEDPYPVLDESHGTVVAGGTEDAPIYSNPEDPDGVLFTIEVTSKKTDNSGGTVADLTGGGQHLVGTYVTVTAPKLDGFTFQGWFAASSNDAGYTGDAVSGYLSYTFKVRRNLSLVAVYKPSGTASLSVTGNAFKVNDDDTQYTDSYSGEITLGKSVTLTYTGGDKFLYWKDENDNILSKGEVYTFTFLGNTKVIAVAVNDSMTGTAFVEFVSAYGQVMMAETYESDSDITLPQGPLKMGQMFQGWSLDGEVAATPDDIKSKISSGVTNIRLTPLYVQADMKYSITIFADGTEESTVNVDIGTSYAVYAPEIAGKQFAYWSSDSAGENVLSYSQHYVVRASWHVTLYAIYADTEEEIEKIPTVVVTQKGWYVENASRGVRFVSTYDVPEGYTILETGAIYSIDTRYGEENAEETFIIGGENIRQKKASVSNSYGTYTLAVDMGGNLSAEVYFRGYVIVENERNGALETYYSEIAADSASSPQ